MPLTPNSIAFLGLCNEYCRAIDNAAETEKEDFVKEMLRLLPRIYISATDLETTEDEQDAMPDDAMEEEHYDSVCRTLESLIGEDDTYLEVFEEDMKYSDTPIGASVSEKLADLMQVFYNLIATARDIPSEMIPALLSSVKYDFENYWSRILCNVMRPLNQIRYN